MAFTFPADKADFTAPNGITYSWDATDEKWRVRSFQGAGATGVVLSEDPPADPSAGDLWFDTSEADLTMFVYTGAEWVPAAPPVSLDGLEDAQELLEQRVIDVEDTQGQLEQRVIDDEAIQAQLQQEIADALETQQQIQDDIADRLPLAGGTVTGPITTTETVFFHNHLVNRDWVTDNMISNVQYNYLKAYEWRLYQPKEDSTEVNYIKIYDGDLKVFNLVYPTDGRDAANKNYVDNTVQAASVKYPGLRFRFGNGTDVVFEKRFNYYANDNGLRLRISNTSKDYKWNDGGLITNYDFDEGHRFTIYEKQEDGSLKIIRTGTYSRVDYHSEDILLHVSSHEVNGSFVADAPDIDYYITASGIF